VSLLDSEFVKGSRKHAGNKRSKKKRRGLQLGYMSEADNVRKNPYTKIFKGKIIAEYILQLRKIFSRKIKLPGGYEYFKIQA